MLTPNLSAELGGGGILISPGLTTYAANAALIMNFQNNSATISYARSAFPSFVGAGEPLIGDRFSLSAIQMIDRTMAAVRIGELCAYRLARAGLDAQTYDALPQGEISVLDDRYLVDFIKLQLYKVHQ